MQDLWADYAGEALATEVAGGGGGLRRRRLTEQATLMMLRAWLLRDYLLPYGTSLGATRIFRRCYWIDGLGHARAGAALARMLLPDLAFPAGPQKHRPATADPSLPLALQFVAETARQLAQLARPLTLYGFALDEKGRGRKLSATIPTPARALPEGGGLLAAAWPELAPALLATIEQSAAVFVLNPLQDGLFRYSDLVPLYQRTAPTELFLWLSHKQIEERLLPGLRSTEGAAALTNLLRGDRWKGMLAREAGRPERARQGLIDLLAESMRQHFLSVQQLVFPVQAGPAQVETAPCTLLFATRRQDSLYSLNDAVCKRARRLLSESQQGILNAEWFRVQREEQAVLQQAALRQETLARGRRQRARRWPDLRLQLLLDYFGAYTSAEYDGVIVDLLARGEVVCAWRKNAGEANGSAIPGPEDPLSWR